MTTLIQPINDVFVTVNSGDTIINLYNHFDDLLTTGQIATFQLYDTSLGNNGTTNVLLFDQAGEGAPLAVDNFVDYVNSGAYTNSIIHRSVPGFVIQGGGFTVNDLQVDDIPTNAPVQNEFSENRSNLRGTIANAKLGGDPNSATSQWFFNLADNSDNLDNQNGGFTVFGQVLSEDDLATIDAIANIPVFDATNIDLAFTDLPLDVNPNNPNIQQDNDYIRYENITLSDEEELTFSVVSNSNPDLVNVTINNNELVIDYLPDVLGTAEITINATNLLGEVETDIFTVSVIESEQNMPTEGDDFLVGTQNADNIDGLGGNDTIEGNQGNDTLIGSQGEDFIFGNPGNDSLSSGFDDDTVYGGQDNDSLFGSDGNDLLLGNRNNDLIDGEAGDDLIYGGQNEDIVFGSDGNDLVFANKGEDIVFGGIGNDSLYGNEGDDTINGDEGDDLIHGGQDNDILDGGLGDDTLFGGLGDDIFVIGENTGTDIIEDFVNGNNLIGLTDNLTFADLTFFDNNIIYNDRTIATIRSIEIIEFTADDFISLEAQ